MKNYELVCILDPQIGDNKFDEVVEKYQKYLEKNGAEVVHVDRWGLRQLAYTSPSLKKRRQGYYVLYQFSAEPGLIRPLEDDLRLDEGVLRHLVVSVQGDFIRVPQLAPENILEERHSRSGREREGESRSSGAQTAGRTVEEKKETPDKEASEDSEQKAGTPEEDVVESGGASAEETETVEDGSGD